MLTVALGSNTRKALQRNMKRISAIRPISNKQKIELKRRQDLKAELIGEYGEHCMKCGRLPDWRGLDLSHIIPLSRGGKTELPNVLLECRRCHSIRHRIIEK